VPSANALKYCDSVLGREDWLAANSRSTDQQQQNTDNQKRFRRNDQRQLTGGPQMLTTCNIGR